jgi:hypothetical protein
MTHTVVAASVVVGGGAFIIEAVCPCGIVAGGAFEKRNVD